MKIYNAIWKDRHTDTTATPFLDLEAAIMWARGEATASCRYREDFEELFSPTGWLYYVRYSCEGDCIYITEHEIDI